jgi:hypothetical protein
MAMNVKLGGQRDTGGRDMTYMTIDDHERTFISDNLNDVDVYMLAFFPSTSSGTSILMEMQVTWYNRIVEIVKRSSTGGSMKTKPWQPPIPAEDDGIFEQIAQLFIDADDVILDFHHGKKASEKMLVRLQERSMEIIKKYQEEMFAQPVPEEDADVKEA